MAKATFKEGDRVRLCLVPQVSNTPADMYDIGDMGEVISGIHNGYSALFVKFADQTILTLRIVDDTGDKTCWHDYFEIAPAGFMRRTPNRNMESIRGKGEAIATAAKPCTCPIDSLMRKGCSCGAISKKAWGLGS